MDKELVWLTEERVPGALVVMGAYFSLIAYVKGGVEYEVWIENDEWEPYDE